jgi:hypothetical protein
LIHLTIFPVITDPAVRSAWEYYYTNGCDVEKRPAFAIGERKDDAKNYERYKEAQRAKEGETGKDEL